MPLHYALVDADGRSTGFMDYQFEPAEADVPQGAIALTDAQSQEWRENPQTRVWVGGALAVVSAPPAARVISSSAFLALFTPAEQSSLWTADPMLMSGALKVITQGTANLDSPEAASLLTLAVTKGVLTDADKARVLAGQPPVSNAS